MQIGTNEMAYKIATLILKQTTTYEYERTFPF